MIKADFSLMCIMINDISFLNKLLFINNISYIYIYKYTCNYALLYFYSSKQLNNKWY